MAAVILNTTEEEQVRKTFPKGDIRGINGYAQKMYQMAEPTAEIQMDRQEHALIKRQVQKAQNLLSLAILDFQIISSYKSKSRLGL